MSKLLRSYRKGSFRAPLWFVRIEVDVRRPAVQRRDLLDARAVRVAARAAIPGLEVRELI